jgi:3-phenylpropionate/cinnamic acid dioxygenase small subunit
MTELERVAALVDIQQVINRYGMVLDNYDFDGYEALFAEDAIFDIKPDPKIMKVPVRGKRAIREAAEGRHHFIHPTEQHKHSASNTVIELLGNGEAKAKSLLLTTLFVRATGVLTVRGTGEYHDKLGVRNGRWVFTERTLVLDLLSSWRPEDTK